MCFTPKKVGFFHFGSADKKTPLTSLERAMQEAGGIPYLRHSIVVLPEASNIGMRYEKNDDLPFNPDFDPKIEDSLRDMAAGFECAFVAGLIINLSGGGPLPHSSAYFISATCSKVLSRKTGADLMEGVLYKSSAELDSPISLGQTVVSALICMDATASPAPRLSNHKRHQSLREKVERLGGSCSILCVAANTKNFMTIGIASEWDNFHFVL